MAALTKYMLSEQVMNLLQGGDASAATPIEMPVIQKMVEHIININLKGDYFTTQLAVGETIPDGLMLATYEKIAVVPYKKNFSRAKLPAIPISLPRNMGYYFIGPNVGNDMLATNLLSAIASGNSQIALTWTAIDTAANYYIERATNAAFTVNLLPVYSGPLLAFTNTGLIASTTYYYRVKGIDIANNESPFVTATATTTA